MVLAFDQGPDRKMRLPPGNLPFDSLFNGFPSGTFVPPESFFVDFSASFPEFSCKVPEKGLYSQPITVPENSNVH
jgi:hypothetical protein